ncbi:MAG: hypothetical protein JNM25_03105 [Planctomycetes bacterium]|nr:hypothetical protein [Planctomycetota bacterium]
MFELRSVGAVVLMATCAVAQGDRFEQVPLRVASLRPDGSVVVDRGRRDLLQPGDRVVLTPRNGQIVQGTVIEVDDRTALVELVDRNAAPPIGTKGHFLLPKARRAQPTADVPLPPKVDEPAPVRPGEEEWQPGMPLLGSTRPPRPEERASRIDGRVYAAADLVRTQDTWSHSLGRAGVDLDASNLRGAGGVLHVNTEFVVATETTENTGADLNVYELSYEVGGTRYQPLHWQVGRLLPRDMPEFGLLDGVEVGLRREGGDRLGVSVGWLPLLGEDMESFADLQVAAWYVWNADLAERMSVALGFQKSWHRYDSDRDLVILRTRYLPIDGWNVSSSVWVDLYSTEDVQKQQSFGVTRANAFASRRWPDAGGLDFAYDHEEYPETIRRELPQTIQPATLVDAHQDRLSMHAYWYSDKGTRWFTRGTGWLDEEREGGSAELGAQSDDMFGKGTRTGLAGFVVQGRDRSQIGARLDHGGPFAGGRLDLLYELGFVHHDDFPANRDDLVQHRLALLFSGDLGGGWDGLIHADATLWDNELSLALGIYLQRHF